MGHAATARRWRNRRNTEQVAPTASSRPPATGCGWPPRARARCAAWPCGSPRASRRRCWARRSADCGRRAGTRSTGSAPSADGPCRRRGSHAAAGCDKATPPRPRSASGARNSRDNGRGRCRRDHQLVAAHLRLSRRFVRIDVDQFHDPVAVGAAGRGEQLPVRYGGGGSFPVGSRGPRRGSAGTFCCR